MFEQFFDGPSRVQAAAESVRAARCLKDSLKNYSKQGYAEITARKHIRAAEHLIYWSGREGIPVSSLTEKFLERFDRQLNQCQCPRYGRTHRLNLLNGARLFLKHLRDTGIIITTCC